MIKYLLMVTVYVFNSLKKYYKSFVLGFFRFNFFFLRWSIFFTRFGVFGTFMEIKQLVLEYFSSFVVREFEIIRNISSYPRFKFAINSEWPLFSITWGYRMSLKIIKPTNIWSKDSFIFLFISYIELFGCISWNPNKFTY